MSTTLVIGAGLAGLAAARALADAGRSVVVLERAPAPGGRASSRARGALHFDHGAQYLTARDERFRSEVARWCSAGVVAPWRGRIVALEGGLVVPTDPAVLRFVGVPRMGALAERLARDLDVTYGVRVEALVPRAAGWSVEPRPARVPERFECALVSAQPSQAALLLERAPSLAARAARVRTRPTWAVLLALGSRYDVPFDGAFVAASALSWVARNSSKPGRAHAEAWVLHGALDWSEAHLADEPAAVVAALTAELAARTGVALPPIVDAEAHRWRSAGPHPPLEEPCLFDPELALGACGDWCGGPRIEGAVTSGWALAERVLGA